jgi:uncharacterized protein YrrD
MKKSAEILGLSVISIGEGKELGTAKDIITDAAKGEVIALIVEDGEWYLGAKILPFHKIQGIGGDAVMIECSTAIIPLASSEEVTRLLAEGNQVKGTKVLTKKGKMKGQVAEIIIDEQSGKIFGCEIKLENGDIEAIPAEQVITFGKDALIISEDGERAIPSLRVVSPEITTQEAEPEIQTSQPAVESEIINIASEGETTDENQEKEDVWKVWRSAKA